MKNELKKAWKWLVKPFKKMTTCTTCGYSNNKVVYGLHLLFVNILILGTLFVLAFVAAMLLQMFIFGGSSFWFSVFLAAIALNFVILGIRKKGGRFTNRYKPKSSDSAEVRKARSSGDAEYVDIFHWKYGGGGLKRGFYAFHSGFSFVLLGSRHQAGHSTLRLEIVDDKAQINFSGDGDDSDENENDDEGNEEKSSNDGNTSNIRFEIGIDYTLTFKFNWKNPFLIYKDMERTQFIENVTQKLKDASRRAIDSATAGKKLSDLMTKEKGLELFQKDVQREFVKIYYRLMKNTRLFDNIIIDGSIDIGDLSLPPEVLAAMNKAAAIALEEAGNRNAASELRRASQNKMPFKECMETIQVNRGKRTVSHSTFGLDEKSLAVGERILTAVATKI